MKRPTAPVPARLEIGGCHWRSATPGDAGMLEKLAARGSNRLLFGLPESEEAFEAIVDRPGYRLPMLCLRGGRPIGAGAIRNRNHRSLNLQLVCFFSQPGSAMAQLAAYVRHVFWSIPVHRVYAQLPAVSGSTAYVKLLKEVGFREEGRVRGHAVIAGRPRDLVALGILRREFEEWCLANERSLAL